MLDIKTILSIVKPELLFASNNIDGIKIERKQLQVRYHPDKCTNLAEAGDFAKVAPHINNLFDQAVIKIADGTWRIGNAILVTDAKSKQYRFRYLNCMSIGICTHAINVNRSLYILNDPDAGGSFDIFFDNAKTANEAVKKLVASTPKIKETCYWLLPTFVEYTAPGNKRALYSVRMNKQDGSVATDSFCLSEIASQVYKGKVPVRHVVWILSRCYNLACLFEHCGYMYGGFVENGLTVEPAEHVIMPSSGWWYSRKLDDKLIGLPSDVVPYLPPTLVANKKSCTRIDLAMIKLLGRKLLGDISGSSLRSNPDIPTQISSWLTDPAGDVATEEFKKWDAVVDAAYGKRVFTVMDVTKKSLYPENT